MRHVFGEHIGSTVEVYVDDIVVKSKKLGDLIHDLKIMFGRLRANNIKLNPEKCVFGVPRGMLLGYIFLSVVSRLTPRKSRSLPKWGRFETSKAYKKNIRLSSGAQSFHLMARRKSPAIVPPPEVSQALHVDRQG